MLSHFSYLQNQAAAAAATTTTNYLIDNTILKI